MAEEIDYESLGSQAPRESILTHHSAIHEVGARKQVGMTEVSVGPDAVRSALWAGFWAALCILESPVY